MATADEIAQLRQIIGETTLTDDELGEIFDRSANMNDAARWVWRMKAAGFATLVDVAESGSSRKMSDMFKHALEMSQFDPDAAVPAPIVGRTRTRRIVRE